MRLGFGLFAAALALGACAQAEDEAERLAKAWGCGPVEGIGALSGDRAPAWLIVGEMTETAEAPAAITDIACHLAASGDKLFVGVQDYFGGATDAETKMTADLAALARKGAPIILATIGGEDHPYVIHERSKAEEAWARSLTARVAASGAKRALLFVCRADAISQALPPSGGRFAGYSPMPVFLKGGVLSLEIAGQAMPGAVGPAIRLHPQKRDGFAGQVVLASLTRPTVMAAPAGAPEPQNLAVAQTSDDRGVRNEAPGKVPSILRDARPYSPSPPISEQERQALLDQLLDSLPETPPQ